MEISWNLEMPYLPKHRRVYPRSAFGSLWTARPEDADRAFDLYCQRLRRGGEPSSTLMQVFEGRPFRSSAVDETYQYRHHWGECAWSGQERGLLVGAMAPLSGPAMDLLSRVMRRKRPSRISGERMTHGDAEAASRELAAAGFCELVMLKDGETGLQLVHQDRSLVEWEISRRHWVCEMLVICQFAYETTQSSLRSYRESGVVAKLEVIGAEDCCPVCHAKYPRPVALNTPVEIPVDGCVNPNNCTCAVAPIVDVDPRAR